MKISEECLREYALTGKDSDISDKSNYLFCMLIAIHGLLLCLFSGFSVLSVCFSVIMIGLYFLVFKLVKKKIGSVKNGYNFLMLSLLGFILSLIALSISVVIYYDKLHSIKDIIIMLVIFCVSIFVFYLLVLYRISKFKPKVKNADAPPKNKIGKSPYTVLILPIVLIVSKLMQQADQMKLVLLFSIFFYLLSILYMVCTCFIIKFIYLKRRNLI